VLLVDVLTQEEMEAIDKRQVRQRSEWKRIRREGEFVSSRQYWVGPAQVIDSTAYDRE
jgi:hypothetical protein